MVTSELSVGGVHCGGTTWSASSSVCNAVPPFEDAQLDKLGWTRSRAQQQLVVHTLQSLKDKAALAFTPVEFSQNVDPFRETFSDGGLFGAGCSYAIGFYGIQGRQPKCEDYVLHLALGPNLFAPFDDCTRACLACVLDGHGGTGAVQYVAERFPSYLLADLPRLRAQPAAAMRAALHRIDEELTRDGYNSGTTVNALLLLDNRVTVVNTGDCRCLVYDFVDERVVQETHDHNLQCTRERERVLGEGAELSGCGGYVVLPCPTDGAKLLGVTKALGHAGVKALQRSYTMGSLSGILEASISPRQEEQQQEQEPRLVRPLSRPPELCAVVAAGAPRPSATVVAEVGAAVTTHVLSGSGMSDDEPVMPASALAGNLSSGPGGVFQSDVDMLPSCSVLMGHYLQQRVGFIHNGYERLVSFAGGPLSVAIAGAAPPAATVSASPSSMMWNGGRQLPVSCSSAIPEAAPSPASPQHCSSTSNGDGTCKSIFATAAGVALAVAVAASQEPAIGVGPRIGPLMSAGTGGSFVLTCEPDEYEFTIDDDRHMLLLGCDGVFDHMKNGEACKTVLRRLTSTNSCIDAAREVTHRACRLGSLDNVTALVLRFGRKPILRRQSCSMLQPSMQRSNSNTSGDLATASSSVTSRFGSHAP